MSIVRPNFRQGVVAMSSGGMVGWFCEPVQGKPTKLSKPGLAPKGTGLDFCTIPVFLGQLSDRLPFFGGLYLPSTRGPFFL